MKLYYFPGACSLASHIALRESGMPFEIDKLDLATRKTASGEDYPQINPKGYVPALRLDDGSILTEGPAILQYVADRKPDMQLAPTAGTMGRYRLQEWLTYIGTEIHKSFGPLFGTPSPEVHEQAVTQLHRRFAYADAWLADKDYLVGGRYSVADIYLFVVSGWGGHVGFDMSPFPNVQKHSARIAARPAVQAALKAEGLIG
ncbi:MAG: glutathione transferase GstA [Betaproteobacteria bacterium]|nr:glutathione transferase GstA [Betaproteobacteria bacterium]MCL2885196.1 glutathione transferase GstA [Betaproteobacteria bacterium]